MLVDYQCHWFSKPFFESLLTRPAGTFPRTERDGEGGYIFWFDAEPVGGPWRMKPSYFDLDIQLADMDQHGIDVAVMAPCLIGEVTHLELAEAKETIAFVNEESARAVKEQPERRRGLAMLPWQDTAAALEALEDAAGRLELSGVSMTSHVAGRPIANEATLPVFRRIAELGLPLVLHPSSRTMFFDSIPTLGRGTEIGLTWMFETSTAALSLIYTGVFDECPTLTVVHPHLGGVLPYLRHRFDAVYGMHLRGQRPLEDYLRTHFYTDVANTTPGALDMAVAMFGRDRILFATDYPWAPRPQVMGMLAEHPDKDLVNTISGTRLPGIPLPTS